MSTNDGIFPENWVWRFSCELWRKKLKSRWMGLGQGSRCASHGWVQNSSVKFNVMKNTGLGAVVENPVSHDTTHSLGSAFVDDTNMYVFGKWGETASDIYSSAVEQVTAWKKLLRVSGGSAKAVKSFWYLMDQVCVNGVWSWKNTQGCELEIEVDDGIREKIVSLPMSEEKNFLGVFDSPEGGNKKQLEKITNKFDTWIQRMRNGHLPPHLGWMSYRFKLWSSVRYGIGAMTNDLEEVEDFLSKRERFILNILGVASTIKKGLESFILLLAELVYTTLRQSN